MSVKSGERMIWWLEGLVKVTLGGLKKSMGMSIVGM